MAEKRKVIWSLESSNKVEDVKSYLMDEWSEKEVEDFLNELRKFENRIQHFP